MSGDEFASFLRRSVPPAEITDARLDALIGGTLLRAQRAGQPDRRWQWLSPRWLKVMQYALPMAVAMVMGFTVSSQFADDLPVAGFTSVMMSSSLIPAGS